MFIRAFTALFTVIALTGVAVAAPSALSVRDVINNQCNSGPVQCCNSIQSSNTQFVYDVFGAFGLPMPPPNTNVAFTCSPITVGGTGTGAACVSQTVCCNGNTFNGISTGCSPTTIIL